ncbi:MAG TPA: hypothetical protein VF345_08825 [Chthoniobacterales bacterium]
MSDPFGQKTAARLMIFGHPAHELALFGLLQRYRPAVVVITDGGAAERIEQSRRGLHFIGLADRVQYLGFSESSFYDALLDRDYEFFFNVARAVQAAIERVQPEQIFCDAVEFYNPVHDVTLPIVKRAARVLPRAKLFEVPLVYQLPGPDEHYAVQRVPAALQERRLAYQILEEELRKKIHARDQIYLNLREQLGPDFLGLPDAYLQREEIALAGDPLGEPASTGREMRYEWRARALQEARVIKEVITYREHFRPVAESLIA